MNWSGGHGAFKLYSLYLSCSFGAPVLLLLVMGARRTISFSMTLFSSTTGNDLSTHLGDLFPLQSPAPHNQPPPPWAASPSKQTLVRMHQRLSRKTSALERYSVRRLTLTHCGVVGPHAGMGMPHSLTFVGANVDQFWRYIHTLLRNLPTSS